MRSLERITIGGIVLVILSPLAGIIGTVWSLYGSFNALERNESAGIGAVGGEIANALIFTICGLLGAIIGVVMIIIGIRKSRKG